MRLYEFITEAGEPSDPSRRSFLHKAAAGGLAAAGIQPAAAAPASSPKYGPPLLGRNVDAEEMLHKYARAAGIKGVELAQFLAQCYHETAGFAQMQEIGDPKYFLRYDPKVDPIKAKQLGNTYPGDGVRYKGRGFIQITGRDNYRRAGEALGIPLEERPELASRPDIASKIAIWYWKNRVRPNVSNFQDTRSVTKQINPNLNGLQSRHENFKDYINVFRI